MLFGTAQVVDMEQAADGSPATNAFGAFGSFQRVEDGGQFETPAGMLDPSSAQHQPMMTRSRGLRWTVHDDASQQETLSQVPTYPVELTVYPVCFAESCPYLCRSGGGRICAHNVGSRALRIHGTGGSSMKALCGTTTCLPLSQAELDAIAREEAMDLEALVADYEMQAEAASSSGVTNEGKGCDAGGEARPTATVVSFLGLQGEVARHQRTRRCFALSAAGPFSCRSTVSWLALSSGHGSWTSDPRASPCLGSKRGWRKLSMATSDQAVKGG